MFDAGFGCAPKQLPECCLVGLWHQNAGRGYRWIRGSSDTEYKGMSVSVWLGRFQVLAWVGGLAHARAGRAWVDAIYANAAGVFQLIGQKLHQAFGGKLRYRVSAPISARFAADAAGGEYQEASLGAWRKSGISCLLSKTGR